MTEGNPKFCRPCETNGAVEIEVDQAAAGGYKISGEIPVKLDTPLDVQLVQTESIRFQNNWSSGEIVGAWSAYANPVYPWECIFLTRQFDLIPQKDEKQFDASKMNYSRRFTGIFELLNMQDFTTAGDQIALYSWIFQGEHVEGQLVYRWAQGNVFGPLDSGARHNNVVMEWPFPGGGRELLVDTIDFCTPARVLQIYWHLLCDNNAILPRAILNLSLQEYPGGL